VIFSPEPYHVGVTDTKLSSLDVISRCTLFNFKTLLGGVRKVAGQVFVDIAVDTAAYCYFFFFFFFFFFFLLLLLLLLLVYNQTRAQV